MTESLQQLPLALALSGGGAQAAYQAGVLKALAEAHPTLSFPIVTGVSAGAINAAALASHPGPLLQAVNDLLQKWTRLNSETIYSVRPTGLARLTLRWLRHMTSGGRGPVPSIRGLLDTAPLRNFLKGAIDFSGIEANIAAGRLKAVALSATSYATGFTVSFVQGAPDVQPWERARRVAVPTRLTLDHVMASAAIPIVFPAIRIGGGFYGDGSVRQDSPLAPAIHLGARRVLAIATRPAMALPPHPVATGEHPSTVDTATLLLDSLFLDALDEDAERLLRVNRLISAISPGTPVPGGLKQVALVVMRPSRDLGSVAREFMKGVSRLPAAIQMVIRGMGVTREAGAGFLSYFLFEPEYTSKLVDLGYHDGKAQLGGIGKFLTGVDG